MRYLLPLVLIGLSGCHLPATLGSIDDLTGPRLGTSVREGAYRPVAAHGGAPARDLQAAVWYDPFNGVASFDLSRPAHVAIFAFHTRGDVELIYPAIGIAGRDYFYHGMHAVRTGFTGYRSASHYRSNDPMYILLIASERPVDTRRFMGGAWNYRLTRAVAGWSPFAVADELVREVVPHPRSTDWTVAYHALWPDSDLRHRDRRPDYVRVACPDGTVVTVSAEAARQGWFRCPDQPRTPQDTARRAVPRVTETVPKRPRPDGIDRPRGTTGTTGERARPTVPERVTRPGERPGGERVAPPKRVTPPLTGERSTPPATRATPPRTRATPPESVRRPVRPGATTTPPTKPTPATRSAPQTRPKPPARPASAGKATVRPAPKPKPKAKPKGTGESGGGQ